LRGADEVRINVMARNSFFPNVRAALLAGAAVACLMAVGAKAQVPDTTQTPVQSTTTTQGNATTTTKTTIDPQTGKPVQSVSTAVQFKRGKKKADAKEEKVVESKSTKKAVARNKKTDALAGVDAKLPDKQLYDKAVNAIAKGHFDVARLDLQTMLNTYPDSQYQMRAKLAIADSWYKEGGTAALTQAESEYKDFTVFFPNAPEAAEAQMRIGDIYFRQMDRPDRDYAKALNAETEYRHMLTDYPDSTLVPQAKQRLRDVQEVLATRESDIASYYATRDNYAAVIARYQTVADTYPLYSHMDDVLIGLGDAYEAQARYVRSIPNMPEGAKAKLEQLYDGEAADMYRKVVMEHAAAPHVEDAKDRLAAMSLPIPTPTKEQMQASVDLENSRSSYSVSNRVQLLFLHKPDTVMASHLGEPTLVDPKATVAPTIVKRANDEFKNAFAVNAAPATGPLPATPNTPAPAPAPTVAAPAPPAAPLAFTDVPTADSGGSPSTSVMSAPAGGTPVSNGTGMSVEIITKPAATGGLKAVGPSTANAPLPEAEKAAPAPDVANEADGKPVTPAQAAPANGKKAPKPALDKADESSSKTKKKKGIAKINPF
jgi:outer membrane protein assembly factor BamD